MYDAAVIGAGIAGMATAARLQACGLSTIVFESHGQPGGCAGYFRRKGFAFDVGATTLVDFAPDGVGGELMASVGMPSLAAQSLPGYVAWLPDRQVILHRDCRAWAAERLKMLGDSPAHRRFWSLLDRLAEVFWRASRRGVKLPLAGIGDLVRAVRAVGVNHLALTRYLRWTMGDLLHSLGLAREKPLVGLLSMLLEDTVHSTVWKAPLVNAALGATIRGAGLSRAKGGMRGFWQAFVSHYRMLGGELKAGCRVTRVTGELGAYLIETRRRKCLARQVVSALPAPLTARIGPDSVGRRLRSYLERDRAAQGGAVVLFLGVPDEEVSGQPFTHHQLLHDYAAPLGDGNNMFISASDRDDTASAPAGYRAVMISTHCNLEPWEELSPAEYATCKAAAGRRLLLLARRVYPQLGERALVYEAATPRTYERFTSRPRGAVGGVRQTLANANQRAVPHDLGIPGFWLAGDTTWPGLGSVACVLGSRIVAEGVLFRHRRLRPAPRVASFSNRSSSDVACAAN